MKKNSIHLQNSLDETLIFREGIVIINGKEINVSDFDNVDMTKYSNNERMEISEDDIDTAFLHFEDEALEREKRRIPKIHGAKERRYIP